ncbi:tRNA (adenosine(37)-N6)-dimethylallyltransferase MiaA [Roseovarius sp. SCSIO 43702]|uniref:tRNA (adenosine(37)-N6)-dimethylallyltransferase MiaA n=1 Tax=Roseovarius sp. SCSIO 43702 TaxID=2823043 RepID=UPI001C72E947|nr:tRNA (adenosine(37)-N6)-dimethylallyltransferase MiaA [Roseovarius sp. SCSIO 43702]QYX58397.1 tRNA (adenosine(37)-N6)-dimethylallyltransferase MiaA [Roseovarius sp. SCSIO 43702]
MTPPFEIDPARPVLIAGPTASGKSALALEIAEQSGGVIVNADSMQVYDNWRILSARPSPQDEARAPHLLYGHVPRFADYSAGHWLREVAKILEGGTRPIIVGGTGLYFRALTEGLAEIPPTDPAIRARADAILVEHGLDALLRDLDAETRGRIDTANPMRVQRAWEVLTATGRGLAAWQAATKPPLLPAGRAHAIVLDAPKDWLTPRIETRFDAMLAAGALEEARANLDGWDPAHPSARAHGGPELVAHLRGEMTLEDARDRATIITRQYAKRQRTWFRKHMRDWTWIRPPSA